MFGLKSVGCKAASVHMEWKIRGILNLVIILNHTTIIILKTRCYPELIIATKYELVWNFQSTVSREALSYRWLTSNNFFFFILMEKNHWKNQQKPQNISQSHSISIYKIIMTMTPITHLNKCQFKNSMTIIKTRNAMRREHKNSFILPFLVCLKF